MADFLFSDGPILSLQAAAGPFLDVLFVLITSTGSIYFFLGAVVLVYWLWDKRLGLGPPKVPERQQPGRGCLRAAVPLTREACSFGCSKDLPPYG